MLEDAMLEDAVLENAVLDNSLLGEGSLDGAPTFVRWVLLVVSRNGTEPDCLVRLRLAGARFAGAGGADVLSCCCGGGLRRRSSGSN